MQPEKARDPLLGIGAESEGSKEIQEIQGQFLHSSIKQSKNQINAGVQDLTLYFFI